MTTMSMASATGAPYTVTSATASRSIEVLTMPDDTSIVFVVEANLPAVKAVAMCSVLTGSPSATARFSSAWTIFSSEGLVIRRTVATHGVGSNFIATPFMQ